jgi:hypothetical protein
MPTKFEDAVAALKVQHFDTPDMLQVLELMVEQNERIKNLEAGSLTNKQAISTLDAASQAHGVSIGSLAQDRQAHATQIAAVVAAPAADSKKVEDLEKRVTAVEGAVGSKMWKRAEAPKPVLPLADPLKPETVVAEPKPSIFSGLTGAPAANPAATPSGTP